MNRVRQRGKLALLLVQRLGVGLVRFLAEVRAQYIHFLEHTLRLVLRVRSVERRVADHVPCLIHSRLKLVEGRVAKYTLLGLVHDQAQPLK